jgi:hypothetical protein
MTTCYYITIRRTDGKEFTASLDSALGRALVIISLTHGEDVIRTWEGV